jgi:hypothetical protein
MTMRTLVKLSIGAMLLAFAMLAPALAAFDPNRVVTAVDQAAGTFSCQAKASEPVRTYATTAKTVFRIAGKRVRLAYLWNKGTLADLTVGAIVTVRYHVAGGHRIAERVAIYPKK